VSESEKVRLDKWLWAARFFKTRSLATEAVGGGKVHVDGARVKPARQVSTGQTLEIQKGPYQAREKIQINLRDERMFARAEKPAGRPSKRDRRQLHRFKGRQNEEG